MNRDQLRQSLSHIAGPEPNPTPEAFDAVRKRARRGRTRRIVVVTALIIPLVFAGAVTVRSLGRSDDSASVAASPGAAGTSWQAFCEQTNRIDAARSSNAEQEAWLSEIHEQYDRLTRLAPSKELRNALREARPYARAMRRAVARRAMTTGREALQTANAALVTRCGRSWLDLFGIGFGFLQSSVSLTSLPQGVSAQEIGGRSVFVNRHRNEVTVFLPDPHGTPELTVLWWCPTERLFVEAAHAAAFDENGTIISGPAMRGLDTLKATVRDGMVHVDTRHVIKGSTVRDGPATGIGNRGSWNSGPGSFCFMPIVAGAR